MKNENQISGKEEKIESIFSNQYEMEIPEYQRPYAWETIQTEDLLDDLLNSFENDPKDEYFLGSIVLVEQSERHYSVVDGQQRLTTLSLLISVLGSLSERGRKTAEKALHSEGDEILEIIETPRLHLRKRDNDFYAEYVPSLRVEELIRLTSNNEVQRRLIENTRILWNTLSKMDEQKRHDFFKYLMKKCTLVVVTTNNTDTAFNVFSVMNHRGLDLQGSDILKSELLSRIPDGQRDYYADLWEDMEERLGRDAFNQFFDEVVMSISKAQYRKGNKKTLRAGDYLLKKVMKNNDAAELFNKVLIPKYKALLTIYDCNYQDNEVGSEINRRLRWLNMIPNKDWVPAAINWLEGNHSGKETLKFFQKLETLAAYMMVVPGSHNLSYRITRYGDIGRQIEEGGDLPALDMTEKEKDEFRKMLNGDIYSPRLSKTFRYLLLRVDTLCADTDADYHHSSFSVEHILPQNVRPGSYWDKNWTETERKLWTNRLGNLIPLSRRMNSSAQNADFNVKKRTYFTPAKAAGFVCVGAVANEQEWTVKEVSARQQVLLKKLFEEWNLYPLDGKKPVEINRSLDLDRGGENLFTAQGSAVITTSEALECLVGQTIYLIEAPEYKALVINRKKVRYRNRDWSLSTLTREIKDSLGTGTPSGAYQGTQHWGYRGKKLSKWTVQELQSIVREMANPNYLR